MSTTIRIGLLRLTDSAPVLVARARSLFKAFDLDVVVSVEPSWSNIADKLGYGLLDAAVMLPPLALASVIGLRGRRAALVVPMGLSQGGNTIVLGGMPDPRTQALPAGARLTAWLRRQDTRPRIAVVHRFSTHNLLMRYWLALTGVDPDEAIETVVVPPEQVVAALAAGQIAGFCAGAPWGVAAERAAAGSVLLGTSAIWPFHPEKCLAVRQEWATENATALVGLMRALMRAQAVCDNPAEAGAIAELLADPDGLRLPLEPVRAGLPGGGKGEQIQFHRATAAFPAPPHAEWFLHQMRRWNWFGEEVDIRAAASAVYRPDLFHEAASREALFNPLGRGQADGSDGGIVPAPGPLPSAAF